MCFLVAHRAFARDDALASRNLFLFGSSRISVVNLPELHPALPFQDYRHITCRDLRPPLRFLELHEEWKSLRWRGNSKIDARMIILPGVFPVACKLESESASYGEEDGLQAVEETLSRQASVVSLVPPSWVAARRVCRRQ